MCETRKTCFSVALVIGIPFLCSCKPTLYIRNRCNVPSINMMLSFECLISAQCKLINLDFSQFSQKKIPDLFLIICLKLAFTAIVFIPTPKGCVYSTRGYFLHLFTVNDLMRAAWMEKNFTKLER